MSEIILRLNCESGRYRINTHTTDMIKLVHKNISELIHIPYDDFMLSQSQSRSKIISNEKQTVGNLGFKNGSFIFVIHLPNTSPNVEPKKSSISEEPKHFESHLTKYCNHKPDQKCIYCTKESNEPTPWLCKHGPGQMCPNCAGVKKDDKIELEMLCLHGPNAFCTNCLPAQKLDVKHQSFIEYMKEQKLNCKHASGQKCIYCLPPAFHSYKVKPFCPKHPPYPRGLCSSCSPEACVLQRQSYRHVDHIEFSDKRYYNLFAETYKNNNYKPIMGFLYGKYVEYQHNGYTQVKACIYSLYIPNQSYMNNKYELQKDEYLKAVDLINNNLQCEIIGLIYAHDPRDYLVSSNEVLMIASYQNKFKKPNTYASQFITVSVSRDNNNNIIPDAFMLSDQALCMFRDGLFIPSDVPTLCKVQTHNQKNELLSTVIVNIKDKGPKEVTTFEPEFLLVQLTIGVPKTSVPPIFKSLLAPNIYTSTNQQSDMQTVLQVLLMDNKRPTASFYDSLFDLNFLAFISQHLGIDTIFNMLYYLKQNKPISTVDYNKLRIIAGY